jgi:hypothetical protein
MPPPIKSAFGKMTPRLQAKPAATRSNGAGTLNAHSSTFSTTKKPPLPVAEATKITVQLWLEVVDNPDKYCASFGYISQDHNPLKLTVVLNKHHWPTVGALARADSAALRWLVAMAVMDRCATWRSHPILAATQRYLVESALGRWLDYQAVAWAAYRLKNCPMFAGVADLATKAAASSQPQKIAGFEVIVDSVRLDFWREKIAKRFRKRPLAEKNATFSGST